MKTVIIASGSRTDMSAVCPDIPSSLIPLDGVPVLERTITGLVSQGFTDIILTVGYSAKQIQNCIGDGSRLGAHVDYYVEPVPLGNAGALFKLNLREDFLLFSADTVFDVDLNRFISFHRRKGSAATVFTHPSSQPDSSSLIIAARDGSIHDWISQDVPHTGFYKNQVNAGLYVISPDALQICGIRGDLVGTETNSSVLTVDLDHHILRPLCGTGRIYAYSSAEYVKTMDTPDRFAEICQDLRRGIIAAKNSRNRQKAIFLDRDGTINRHIGFLRSPDELELLPGAASGIRRINESGYLAIVATNQPVIARGEVTTRGLQTIHNKMETLLGREKAYIDALYYCPHHPDKGFPGEVPSLKIECQCRKPKPGMLLNAASDFNVDLSQSWMIGDSKADILAGIAAGCRTALIGTDDFGQTLTVSSLAEAVDIILASN